MKKILTILSLVVCGAMTSFSQGTIAVYTIASTFSMYTSSTTWSSSMNGVYNTSGTKTANVANSYYYALLVQPYASISSINPLDPNYTLGMMATNFSTGGIHGAGGSAGAPVANWGAPTGGSYNTASEDNFLLVGWSASLGTTWTEVSALLASNFAGNTTAGYFGVSGVGYGYSGGGPNALIAANIFGSSTAMPGGLPGGITMYAVPVPEPATFALAGLGGLALLGLRRRKQ